MQPTAPHIRPVSGIDGAWLADIRAFADDRGAFMESFHRDWFPWINWDNMQANCSRSKANVLRGLHFHHRQIDYWFVVSGEMRVGMADLRPSSPTFKQSVALSLSADKPTGLFIPVGVAHGFVALTDVTLTYLVNNYYDGTDEHGVAWNDPELAVPWNVSNPLISGRDAANPVFSALPEVSRPR
ncbi:MAG: dTDP-4-dehydrorhamnose 3,5-epimerase [Pleurocapsa minor GSE-CHR-MK-17-07R]|jgi:dTDP-4-dehydrorhamnose 3,5-epimerase|nr:dTDP-4-dehydrorhamnose 3,5-epimerase [Pleurocapsa minor GSE-CHR-MK 17-07R]